MPKSKNVIYSFGSLFDKLKSQLSLVIFQLSNLLVEFAITRIN